MGIKSQSFHTTGNYNGGFTLSAPTLVLTRASRLYETDKPSYGLVENRVK